MKKKTRSASFEKSLEEFIVGHEEKKPTKTRRTSPILEEDMSREEKKPTKTRGEKSEMPVIDPEEIRDRETLERKIREDEGRVAFMFIGRTTPPTRGHLKAFIQMIELRDSIDRDIPIILNLSPSSPIKLKVYKKADEFQDPLECDKKIKYISSMLKNLGYEEFIDRNIFIICYPESPTNFRGVQLFKFMRDNGFDDLNKVIVFIGEDRFTGSNPMGQYTSISRNPKIEVFVIPRNVKTDPTKATKIREIILTSSTFEEAKDKLIEAYTLDETRLLDDGKLEELYNDVKEGMKVGMDAVIDALKVKDSLKKTKKGRGRRKRLTRRKF